MTLTERTLKSDLRALSRHDAHVAAALDRFGWPVLRRRPPGFEALLRAIVAQQISIHAAASIWKRIEAAVVPLEAKSYCAVADETLRACGLSRQKLLYMRSLAELVASGDVPLDALDALADEEAIAQLVKIKGVGRWTAEIYLMFALGRRDIWPADDLGLMVGMQRLKNLRKRPDRKRMLVLGKSWQPYRSAGAHLLWHYFHETQAEAKRANGEAKKAPRIEDDPR
ncbi:MAG: DNA-3-methyladenine glycosylase 2 family protein [Rhodospirillaceae bacterium]|nr:DNA-3-methyladenine glycosylase 2 family protein [Rhodospirillaceae bacterium]